MGVRESELVLSEGREDIYLTSEDETRCPSRGKTGIGVFYETEKVSTKESMDACKQGGGGEEQVRNAGTQLLCGRFDVPQ